MAKGRKLTDDVSIEELLLMRDEEGLSNYEIAMRVGVAKNTIYRLIGKQPPTSELTMDCKRQRRSEIPK